MLLRRTLWFLLGCLLLLATGCQPSGDEMLQGLESPRADTRNEAKTELTKRGRLAVPWLLMAIRHHSPLVRAQGAEVIARLGPEAAALAPDLLRLLSEQHSNIRGAALDALNHMGMDAIVARHGPQAFAMLGQMMEPHYPLALRMDAALALGSLGIHASATANDLIRAFHRKNPDVMNQRLVWALGQMGAKALPLLQDILREGEPFLGLWAMAALRSMGSLARGAAPVLLDIGEHASCETKVRAEVVSALGAMQDASPRILSLIKQTLACRYDKAKEVALAAIDALGQKASALHHNVLALLDSPTLSMALRYRVLAVLARLKRRSTPLKTKLDALLHSTKVAESVWASYVLFQLWNDSAGRAHLQKALSVFSDKYKEMAARALALPGSRVKFFSKGLRKALKIKAPSLARAYAADALATLGADAVASIPALRQALDDTRPIVKERVVRALGQIGSRAALLALVKALRGATPRLRREIAWAFGRIKTDAGSRFLMRLLSDADWRVRFAAVRALASYASGASTFGLRMALKNSFWLVRLEAVEALASRKQWAKSLVPALEHVLDDKEFIVRSRARWSIDRLLDRPMPTPVLPPREVPLPPLRVQPAPTSRPATRPVASKPATSQPAASPTKPQPRVHTIKESSSKPSSRPSTLPQKP